jgi:hypothetical protein
LGEDKIYDKDLDSVRKRDAKAASKAKNMLNAIN